MKFDLNDDDIQLIRLSLQNYQNSLGHQFEKDQMVCRILSIPEDGLAPLQDRIADVQNLLEDFSGQEPKTYSVNIKCARCGQTQKLENATPLSYRCSDDSKCEATRKSPKNAQANS
jgi:hypothetical protein